MLRPLALALLLPLPALAQEEAPGLMERGARMFLEGLMKEMEPALDEMGSALREIEPALRDMGPALRQLVELMGDVRHYEAPERMPNGDILIRRKPGAPPPPAAAPTAPPGEVEL
ncbi:MAG TPA: hypothetical protein PKD10_05420 [Paracoccaceae bacterium]|nr:hypothetical protein [Paracoccaceae bacterium]HMO72540.1 hypothetical protein [Paracoccaceae bacterium]